MAKKKVVKTFEYEDEMETQEPEIDEVEEVEVEEVEKKPKEQNETQKETKSSDLDLDWGVVFVFNDYE